VGQKVNLDKRSGVFFGYKHRLNNSMPHCVPTCSPFFVLFLPTYFYLFEYSLVPALLLFRQRGPSLLSYFGFDFVS
jgi:hypothetical protein